MSRRCHVHAEYNAISKPTNECPYCWDVWAEANSSPSDDDITTNNTQHTDPKAAYAAVAILAVMVIALFVGGSMLFTWWDSQPAENLPVQSNPERPVRGIGSEAQTTRQAFQGPSSVQSALPKKLDSQKQEDIEQAFRKSGMNLCNQLTIRTIINYYLLERACPPKSQLDLDKTEGLFGVSVEPFASRDIQDQATSALKKEFGEGTSFPEGRGYYSAMAWRYGRFLIVVNHTAPASALARLAKAMAELNTEVAFDNRTPVNTAAAAKFARELAAKNNMKSAAIMACRRFLIATPQSLAVNRKVVPNTVDSRSWDDLEAGREESPGIWIVSGIITVKGGDHPYFCRMRQQGTDWARMYLDVQ